MRDLLGHASIITTVRYDKQKLENHQITAGRLERGETFDRAARTGLAVKLSSFCQEFGR